MIRLAYDDLPLERKELRRHFYTAYLVLFGGLALTRPNEFLARTRTADKFKAWSEISVEELENCDYMPQSSLFSELDVGRTIALWKLAKDSRIRDDVRTVMRRLVGQITPTLRQIRKLDREEEEWLMAHRQNTIGVEPPKPPSLNPKWDPMIEPPSLE